MGKRRTVGNADFSLLSLPWSTYSAVRCEVSDVGGVNNAAEREAELPHRLVRLSLLS